ncbi:unnamed protein product [Polarella glacialis]|uniref:Uncharacterized protein n=1 Tax=Polarella glacialis TaxID=89957 RepID=A0A813KBE3_POLGL|nr:unnamed protein product [Polarella glacialis]
MDGVEVVRDVEMNADLGEEVDIRALAREVSLLKAHIVKKEEAARSLHAAQSAVSTTFFEKCLSTAVAQITSRAAYELIVFGFFKGKFGDDTVIARLIYALFATIVFPGVAWLIRGNRTAGETWWKDYLKLLGQALPIMIAWAWKDFVSQVIGNLGNKFYAEISLAVGLTVFVAILQFLPCFSWATKSVNEGGDSDTILARYCIVAGQVALALGYAWNQVATWLVGRVQEKTQTPIQSFLAQLAYLFLITSLIAAATRFWQSKAAKVAEELADRSSADPTTSTSSHTVTEARAIADKFGDLTISSSAFVYGWGLLDTLDQLWFTLINGCTSSTSCTAPSNLIYSVGLSIIFSYLTAYQLGSDDKIISSLRDNAMALTVGWAWMNFFNVSISNATDGKGGWNLVLAYFVLLFAYWICTGWWYHTFLQRQRAEAKALDKDLL